MEQCCLCKNTHKHPRGAKAIDVGWTVFEGKMELRGVKKEVKLVFCPDHKTDETWAKIIKEFPPPGAES